MMVHFCSPLYAVSYSCSRRSYPPASPNVDANLLSPLTGVESILQFIFLLVNWELRPLITSFVLSFAWIFLIGNKKWLLINMLNNCRFLLVTHFWSLTLHGTNVLYPPSTPSPFQMCDICFLNKKTPPPWLKQALKDENSSHCGCLFGGRSPFLSVWILQGIQKWIHQYSEPSVKRWNFIILQ